MSGLYEGLRKRAAALLQAYGAPVTFRRKVEGAYDPASGRTSGGPELEWRASAVRAGLSAVFVSIGTEF